MGGLGRAASGGSRRRCGENVKTGPAAGLLDAVAEHALATYVSAKASVVAAASADDVDPIDDLRAEWQTQIDFGIAHPTLGRPHPCGRHRRRTHAPVDTPEQRDPALADDLFDAVLRRIVTDAAKPPDDGPVASAVALSAIAAL